ncbi:Z1 domain [Serratia marcescens]|uniref:Z1 domain-containing protein n=1 Tax=Serratia marcescens TaxID=615 RepID=UPI0007452928|nr:Z1 domain-containing protein [Serratia marcescens]MBH2878831.1 Z1 domain-containing protein [Serratia marcescens]CAI1109168.1 Z1 domain [Serratia marcescens]CAI2502285.1 Z1 domain [Serratia marcescens]CVH07320.1 Z1 domain [Serratia marcescens]
MANYSIDPAYDKCRAFIDSWRLKGKSWDEIAALGRLGESLEKVDSWFRMQEEMEDWPSLGNSPEERCECWREIVRHKKHAEQQSFAAARPLIVVGPEEAEPGFTVPQDGRSAWQLYRKYLLNQGWKKTSVDNIQESALRVLKHFRQNTKDRVAVKGLVVGHVQSGKTANMAGLISMAADYRWNLFVVLTGTLENLRVQTGKRLVGDLFQHDGNLSWKSIEHPSSNSPYGARAQDMQFDAGRRDRHLVVCLKNPARLKHLIDWISAHPQGMSQMRLVVIDDEADQAGINSNDVSKDERTVINDLILRLIRLPLQSVNYVAFTATPAANFLNEGPSETTLYPTDFIAALPQADEHFGPVQIFGYLEQNKEPLGIVREVSGDDLEKVRSIHKGDDLTLPQALRESLVWYLCCVAVMRVSGSAKPVSMLIHTSARQVHHDYMSKAVQAALETWSKYSNIQLEQVFRQVWENVSSELDVNQFSERFPDYGRLSELHELPTFDSLLAEIRTLLSMVTAIQLDADSRRIYHRGIHVCVDNCANNGVTDENEVRRLFYPDDGQCIDFCTAFIVIGGGTLSRGLTIENLVSTFFLRGSAQADSLMQMGRWFGYRKGYELLPRIWMSNDTRAKYEFMTVAEEELRDDLQRFMHGGSKPEEYGPRVRVHARLAWIRPTGANRMQSAIEADFDFSGINRQTTVFHDGDDAEVVLNGNLHYTEEFLNSLGSNSEQPELKRSHNLVWRNVDVSLIAEYLARLSFHPGNQFFSDINAFLKWLGEHATNAGYTNWNVVVAGSSPKPENTWVIGSNAVGRINRTRFADKRSDDGVSIGALRDPKDLLADVLYIEDSDLSNATFTNSRISELRCKGGVGNTPQLLIYLIDKVSKYDSLSKMKAAPRRERASLNAKAHIIGISLYLPGSQGKKQNYATHVTVHIPEPLSILENSLEEKVGEI